MCPPLDRKPRSPGLFYFLDSRAFERENPAHIAGHRPLTGLTLLRRTAKEAMLASIEPPDPTKTQAWLSFLSTLIWQSIIVVLLIAYRRTIASLLKNVKKIGLPGLLESEFQSESPQALHAEATVEVKTLGVDGFLTKAGIEQLISKSGFLEPGEKINDSLLLFQTPAQRTWLVSTGKTLFCVLDDASTRQSGQLIQWKGATASIKRVAAWKEGRRYAVDIGTHGSWLYSPHLHPDPEALKEQIRSLLH